MANRQVYNWIAADPVAIAALQTYVAAATLVLNGTLGSFQNGAFGAVTLNGIARVVTLTSANNLSGINVTITGTRDGVAVSQTIAGPNANTVVTTTLFNTITRITTSGAVTAISVGTGQTGVISWYKTNNLTSVMNVGIQAVVTGTISYTLQLTLDEPNNPNINPPSTVFNPAISTPIVAMTAATTNQLTAITIPNTYMNFIINSSTGGATATFTFVAQGID